MSNHTPTRVNIQFSIEMDDLPIEVSRLLERSSEHTTAASQVFSSIKTAPEILSASTWNQLDTLRMSLSKADGILDDVQKILGGYLQMQNEQFAAPEGDMTQPTEGEPIPSDSTLIPNHPDRAQQKADRGRQMADARQQMSTMMSQMQNMQNSPIAAATEEEKAAMDIMKKRAQRVMETSNEEPPNSKEPSV
jgi:hypothetical protein|tara:strand:- start:3642 stop:4217 length:576 start_codon:yes stop_codon:yes gene_type:complete